MNTVALPCAATQGDYSLEDWQLEILDVGSILNHEWGTEQDRKFRFWTIENLMLIVWKSKNCWQCNCWPCSVPHPNGWQILLKAYIARWETLYLSVPQVKSLTQMSTCRLDLHELPSKHDPSKPEFSDAAFVSFARDRGRLHTAGGVDYFAWNNQLQSPRSKLIHGAVRVLPSWTTLENENVYWRDNHIKCMASYIQQHWYVEYLHWQVPCRRSSVAKASLTTGLCTKSFRYVRLLKASPLVLFALHAIWPPEFLVAEHTGINRLRTGIKYKCEFVYCIGVMEVVFAAVFIR